TGNISTVKVELPSPSPTTSHTGTPSPPTSLSATAPQASSTSTSSSAALPQSLSPSSLLTQMSSLGPTDRCTPSQAQAMGQQVLAVIALHEKNTLQLPLELQNSFDVFHRCLAVVFGTFFLNLYSKANAPCLLCHGCKSLYPPGQFIHHNCPALSTTIVPCRSRMWRRCLVPLVSPGVDKLQQKQRWKYVLEKFSHNNHRRQNPIPANAEAQILEIPECKRGRFVATPATEQQRLRENGGGGMGEEGEGEDKEEEEMEKGSSATGIQSFMKNHSNSALLDVEPPDCEEEDCTLESLATMDSTIPCPSSHPSPSPPPRSHTHSLHNAQNSRPASSALGLAEQLVLEVKRLQQELSLTRTKLTTAEELIHKMPSEACMREQLAQALAVQQQLSLEKEQAQEQARLARERADHLQHQVNRLRIAHGEMEKFFSGLS
ncbi:Ski oncogene, partial [Geodia barretti]